MRTMSNTKEKAKIRAGASIKVNLGNYESAGVEASIELPCDVQDVPKEFERAWAEVNRQLEMRVAEIKQGRSSR
jgi:hypothetical protein